MVHSVQISLLFSYICKEMKSGTIVPNVIFLN